jgi:tetratricopeptide (TPR) repeat protein/serine/threonine protein kinase
MPLFLLKCVGKAALNVFGGGLAGDIVFEVIPDVAQGAWQWWQHDVPTPQERRADLEAIAGAPVEEIRHAVQTIVLELAGDKPDAVQQALSLYLEQVPAQIRKSLRCPADPLGRTVSWERIPDKADDLVSLLPTRLPRFRPGDHPLPGVDWELEELLGVGGFGEVWKARNPHLASVPPVALKFCLEPSAAAFLRNEAAVLDRVMRQGRHPGIVTLERTYLSAETPCLEYEFVGGGDLAGLIQEWHRGTRPSPAQISSLACELARIVAHAHGQSPPIVHRDLKPANVLRMPSGDGVPRLKVADFGIGGLATRHAVRQHTQHSSRGLFLVTALRGSCTPLYASPQQMRGDPPDPRDDVYSLGVIWYQMLTGDLTSSRPGGARWQKRLTDQGLSPGLVATLAECFEDDPADRLPHAAALAERLASLLDGSKLPVSLPASSPASAPSPSSASAVLVPTTPPVSAPSQPLRSPMAPIVATLIPMPHGSGLGHTIAVSGRSGAELAARARASRLQGDLAAALAECASALQLDPGNVQVWYDQAEIQRLRGQFDEAIAAASEAIRLDPNCAEAWATRGAARSQQGDLDGALLDLETSLRLRPGYAWAYGARAEVHRLAGDFQRAIADSSEAIRLDPNIVKAWYTRGEAQRMLESHDRAIADCTEAIRLDPRFAWAYATRGAAHRMKGDYNQAIADCTEAIRLDPGNVLAWYNRAESYRLKNNHARAITDCTEALRLDPKHAWAYGTRGAAYRAQNQHDQAMADLDEAIRLQPRYAWAWAVRGETHRLRGDHAAAIADCTEAIRLDPRSSLAYATRGAAFRQRGDFATATADLNEALRISPNYQWAHDQLDLARRRRR